MEKLGRNFEDALALLLPSINGPVTINHRKRTGFPVVRQCSYIWIPGQISIQIQTNFKTYKSGRTARNFTINLVKNCGSHCIKFKSDLIFLIHFPQMQVQVPYNHPNDLNQTLRNGFLGPRIQNSLHNSPLLPPSRPPFVLLSFWKVQEENRIQPVKMHPFSSLSKIKEKHTCTQRDVIRAIMLHFPLLPQHHMSNNAAYKMYIYASLLRYPNIV